MTIPNQPIEGGTTTSRTDEENTRTMVNPKSSPTLLKNSAARQSCCIFRIPHTLVQSNQNAYKPKIVSIGPYHYRDPKDGDAPFQMIQEHKQRYLDIFLSKARKKGVSLEALQNVVSEMEHAIRDSYSQDLKCNQQELIDMMVLDGCFTLMLFLVGSRKVRHKTCEDPLFVLRWILPTLRSDLLLLENQVPLFLLRDLLKTSKLVPNASLNEMIFEFFAYSIIRPQEFWDQRKDLEASHLLDLIRKTFIPDQSQQTGEGETRINISPSRMENCFGLMGISNRFQGETPAPDHHSQFLKPVVSVRKLQLGGIKFVRKDKFDTPLDLTFKNGVLEIPILTFDDFFSSFLINCVAFEQFNVTCSTEMTSYVTFMGYLMNSQEDATFLTEKGIIENYFGSAEQVSLFFKNTGKDIAFSISKSFLKNVFEEVNKYVSQGYHVQWAGFKYTHFNSPWTFLSSFAALVLLLLTIFQSFFSVYAYFHPLG